ncbi:hypothetical protein BO221_40855 [Archangium sp. Cb G35]|uniref:hypothetical protein n=1 Tax=Archangium sp. Cb G35 TaxID=1920190 RepID=UPI000937D808|nr:hypothetical protein [Archangium sp. Cb G35]OJT18417.1 hypothetical protein BO221_40855 [Archangium sp. Cb G35]
MFTRRVGLNVLALAVLMTQCACVTTASRGTPGSYGYSNAPVGIDSPSATCRNSLSACVALYGKEMASTTAVLKVMIDETTKNSIEEELKKCAELARSEVLLRYPKQFKGPAPDAGECKQETKAQGRRVTWAMRLGIEMHEAARNCTEEALGKMRPGRFSLEQRYRPDMETGEKELVRAEEEQALEESGNGGELKGTLKPDVVIHDGDPLNALAVYDFKFPCVSSDSVPEWHQYPDGHPFAGFSQGEMYQNFIALLVARVIPRLGVVRG